MDNKKLNSTLFLISCFMLAILYLMPNTCNVEYQTQCENHQNIIKIYDSWNEIKDLFDPIEVIQKIKPLKFNEEYDSGNSDKLLMGDSIRIMIDRAN